MCWVVSVVDRDFVCGREKDCYDGTTYEVLGSVGDVQNLPIK